MTRLGHTYLKWMENVLIAKKRGGIQVPERVCDVRDEYAFDVTLSAVVRIKTTSEQTARAAMRRLLDCAGLNVVLCDPIVKLRITEASICDDAGHCPFLFEVDGSSLE